MTLEEEIKFWVNVAQSEVYKLKNNLHLEDEPRLERVISIIKFIQGLLNDLSDMLKEDS